TTIQPENRWKVQLFPYGLVGSKITVVAAKKYSASMDDALLGDARADAEARRSAKQRRRRAATKAGRAVAS
ncbi:MAG: hypothetical protein ACYDAQ_16635, partial [Mycobacteriales bacterium]